VRSLILGGGAIGQFLAACLKQAGHNPTIFARAEQANAIAASGIAMRRGDRGSTWKVAVADGPASATLQDPFELVIVAVKAYSTPEAIASIAGITACQNAPLGAAPHNWVMAAFAGSGLEVRAAADWRGLKWSKLLVNILGNAVCAALDWSPEQVYANREAFAIERRCLLEAIDVMHRLGLAPINLIDYPSASLAAAARGLPASVLRVVLANRVAKGRGGKLPSLLIDLRAHRPRSEVTALNGAVASRAYEAGVPGTANAAVSAVVSGIADGTLSWDRYRGHPERLLSFP
jgi:2-dehydropantoate 2-reductase